MATASSEKPGATNDAPVAIVEGPPNGDDPSTATATASPHQPAPPVGSAPHVPDLGPEQLVASFNSLWSGFTSSVTSAVSSLPPPPASDAVNDALAAVSSSVRSVANPEALESQAQALGTSAASAFASATESIKQFDPHAAKASLTQNAENLFATSTTQDAALSGFSTQASIPPWEALPGPEQQYKEALREELFKVVVDGIYSKEARNELFLSGVAAKNGYSFDFQKDGHLATGALAADGNMKRLRIGLVPRHLKEQVFWDTYMFHVERLRKELVANNGKLDRKSEEQDKARKAATAKAEASKATAAKSADGGDRNWDEEIDKIFDDDDD